MTRLKQGYFFNDNLFSHVYASCFSGDLIVQSAQYEVPDFLLAITQEAMVSARDILILQKSHIQRQNPSYNLSR